MENQLKIIKSEKGKDLVLVNTCKYRHIRQRKDGKMKWRCIHKTCNASILTDSRRSILLETLGEHNHILDTVEKIQRQILRENCKRKANDTISAKPSKIIKTELLKVDFEVPNNYIKSVRKTMNDLLRKDYPTFPLSLNSAITQLKEMQNEDRFKFKNENFIHVPENQNFICITTKTNINLLTQCDGIFIDGTFEYAPKYFLQLYTIHGFKNGFYIPLVYFFLPDKCEETYIQMWTFLKNICFEYLSTRLYIHTLHVDFDKAAHEAAKTMFPGITIIGSRFHLGQTWWRKIQEHNILRTSYLTDGNELGIWLKSFFGLPFLPLEKVEEGFLELMSTCPNESEGYIFSDYILESFIEPGCLFPPELWASEPSISPRTTNETESFHEMYYGQFHSAHPPTHVVVSILMEIQAETMIKINSIARNVHKEMRSSDLQRMQNVIRHFYNYKIHKNTIKYLTSIGLMYQEKKLY